MEAMHIYALGDLLFSNWQGEQYAHSLKLDTRVGGGMLFLLFRREMMTSIVSRKKGYALI
jgi:hypothetical protein